MSEDRQLASITVDLQNGAGSITLSVHAKDWATIGLTDREWLFAMVDSLKEYAEKTELR